jgi:hypothetical protein
MAITIPIVTEFKDAGLQRAEQNLQGFAGKAKGLLGGLGISSAQAGAAMAVGLGVKAVQAFQNLALEAGKMADATGLAVEDASRLIAVAGDLGIESGRVESAVMKMNKSIADGGKAFDQFGIEIFRTNDGLVDANKTFINAVTTIGKIEDPTLRAKAAQEVFGKSYAEISELMAMSAGDLERALGKVSDQQIITNEERDRARKFREQLDNLADIAQDASIALGEQLVPILGEMSDAVVVLDNALDALSGDAGGGLSGLLRAAYDSSGLGQLVRFINDLGDIAGLSADDVDELAVTIEANTVTSFQMEQMYRDRLPNALGNTSRATNTLTTDIESLDDAYRELTDNISDRKAWRDFQTSLLYFRSSMTLSTEEADQFALALGNIVNELDGIDDETRIKLLTELDRGDLDYVFGALERLRQGVTVPIRPSPTNIGLPQLPGNPAAPTITNVVPNVPTIQRPNVGLPISSESSGTMTINISTSADPNEVIRAIETYRRRNGTTVV